MPEQPSYYTSTLSQLMVGAALVFSLGAVLSGVGIVWFKLPVEVSKELMGPFTLLLTTFSAAYLTARRSGNGPPTGGAPA